MPRKRRSCFRHEHEQEHRRDDERAGERELVHVGPRHAPGGEAAQHGGGEVQHPREHRHRDADAQRGRTPVGDGCRRRRRCRAQRHRRAPRRRADRRAPTATFASDATPAASAAAVTAAAERRARSIANAMNAIAYTAIAEYTLRMRDLVERHLHRSTLRRCSRGPRRIRAAGRAPGVLVGERRHGVFEAGVLAAGETGVLEPTLPSGRVTAFTHMRRRGTNSDTSSPPRMSDREHEHPALRRVVVDVEAREARHALRVVALAGVRASASSRT